MNKDAIKQQISDTIIDNTTGEITPQDVREVLINIVDGVPDNTFDAPISYTAPLQQEIAANPLNIPNVEWVKAEMNVLPIPAINDDETLEGLYTWSSYNINSKIQNALSAVDTSALMPKAGGTFTGNFSVSPTNAGAQLSLVANGTNQNASINFYSANLAAWKGAILWSTSQNAVEFATNTGSSIKFGQGINYPLIIGTTGDVTVKNNLIVGTTNVMTAINGKAASTHTHAISDVTNLQSTLDGKASTGNTITNTGSAVSVSKMWVGTLAQYNAITTKDAATLYFIQ